MERIGAAHELVELVDGDLLVGADGDDLLREDVERVARHARLLDLALRACALTTTADSSRSARNFGKIRPFDGSSTRWPARPMRCKPARHGLGRLDLDDEVDGAHVDAELERRRRHERGKRALLQKLLDLDPLLARERAVVCARDLALRRSFRRSARRSARRRLLTKTIVERCSCTSRRSSG